VLAEASVNLTLVSVRIGLGFSAFPFSGPEAFWRWVDACERQESVDSLWLSERLVSAQAFLEPLSTLASIAGRTRRLKFGMNATVLPLRDPLVLAKECATIDYLSGGRLLPMFGVGNDASPEWQAVGVEASRRGRRSNEMLALLNRLWAEDNVSFDGKYYQYRDVTISPKPKQQPMPLWIGGSSEAAIERTAHHGNGWLAGAAQTPAQIGRVASAIKARASELGRIIDEDHFGCGISFRFGSWEEPVVQRAVQAFRSRAGPDAEPRNSIAVGDAEDVLDLVQVYRACGAFKFVARPIASSDEEMLDQSLRLAAEIAPVVNQMS
jgi:probable F420-dependent oxidoreductase